MNDDRFDSLEQDIMRSVGRILSSREMEELRNTINDAIDQADRAVKKAKSQRATRSMERNSPFYKSYGGPYTPPPSRGSSRSRSAYQSAPYTRSTSGQSQSTAIQPYRNQPIRGTVGAGLGLGFGITALVLGLLILSAGGIMALLGTAKAGAVAVSGLVLGGGGLFGTISSGIKLGRLSRYRKYLRALGKDPLYTVKELAQRARLPEERVQQDLPQFLQSVSLPYAKMDEEQTCLILEPETYQQYLDLKENRRRQEEEEAARQAKAASDPNAAALEQMRQDGLGYIQRIRAINDALPEQNISQKLDKLEGLCRNIFAYVEKNPDKLPQIRKLMIYYLPTTLKLVEAYENMENHQLATAAVEASKEDIRKALDNINEAFQALYDRLMQNDRMDLSAEISVLETMLAQEGLRGEAPKTEQ